MVLCATSFASNVAGLFCGGTAIADHSSPVHPLSPNTNRRYVNHAGHLHSDGFAGEIDLSSANLANTYSSGARLIDGAQLRGVNFAGALFNRAHLNNVDCQHRPRRSDQHPGQFRRAGWAPGCPALSVLGS